MDHGQRGSVDTDAHFVGGGAAAPRAGSSLGRQGRLHHLTDGGALFVRPESRRQLGRLEARRFWYSPVNDALVPAGAGILLVRRPTASLPVSESRIPWTEEARRACGFGWIIAIPTLPTMRWGGFTLSWSFALATEF